MVFGGISVVIPHHQECYILYVPSTRKIISSYDFIFYEILSNTLSYTSQPYAEVMTMRPSISYIPCATSSKEQTDNIITFTQFEEGNLVSETHNNAE